MCPGLREEEDNMNNQDHWLGATGCHPAPLTSPGSWVPWGQQSPAWPGQHRRPEPKRRLQWAGRRCQHRRHVPTVPP